MLKRVWIGLIAALLIAVSLFVVENHAIQNIPVYGKELPLLMIPNSIAIIQEPYTSVQKR